MKRPPRTDFTDAEKQRRGIPLYDPAVEIDQLKLELKQLRETHQAALERVVALLGGAIAAIEDGRRGDGLSTLRAIVRAKGGKLKLEPPTPGPRAA